MVRRASVERFDRMAHIQDRINLVQAEKEGLCGEILVEVIGFGPLEPLVQDPSVSDILVNTYSQVYVERYGKLEPTDVRFKEDAHLRKIIDKIVIGCGEAHR